MKPLFFVLSLVLLAGCTTAPTGADRTRTKRIGVVSLMGDKVTASYVSLTMFTHQHYEVSAPDLGVDDSVEQEAAHLLGEGGVPLPEERSVGRSTRFLGIRDLEIDSARIVAAAQRHQLDGLLVVYPLLYHGAPANLEGVTLMGHFSYRDQIRPVVFAGVNFYNARTGKRLGHAVVNTPHDSVAAALSDGTPVVWKKTYTAYSTEDRTALREAIRNQLRESLGKALGRINFPDL